MKLVNIRILFAILFILLLGLCYVTFRNLSGYMREVGSIRHKNNIINTAQEIFSSIKDAETGHRGFQLSADSSYLAPYYQARKTIPQQFNKLDSLSKKFRLLAISVDTLGLLINKQFIIIDQILGSPQRDTPALKESDLALLQDGKQNMNLIRGTITRIIRDQQESMIASLENEGGFKNLTPISFLTTALIAIGGVLLLFTRVVLVLEERDKKANELASALNTLSSEVETRKYTQDLLRNVLDNSLDGIMALESVRDKDGQIIDFKYQMVNESSFGLLNQRPSEITGKQFLTTGPPKAIELFKEFEKVVETGVPYKTELKYEINKAEAWFKLVVVKLEDGCQVTFTDITSDKLNEFRREKFTMDLKRSNEDLEQFAYVASHDLQEPLRKIRSFGDRLVTKYSDAFDETGLDYIKRMQTAASRMQTLIEDLLSFSRVSNTSEEFANVNLEFVLDEITDDLSDQILRKNASIVFSAIPPILGIRNQIKRLFQNLINNGIKFSKPDTNPSIIITSKVVSNNEVIEEFDELTEYTSYVRIEVSDNGIGFDEKYAVQIFNIFQRLHGKAEFEGTGIGLAICKRIVTNHKGFIKAESQEGIGSKFIIILPNYL